MSLRSIIRISCAAALAFLVLMALTAVHRGTSEAPALASAAAVLLTVVVIGLSRRQQI